MAASRPTRSPASSRRFRAVARLVGSALIVLLVAGRAWERWGPVAEHPVPTAALVRQWSVTTCGPAAVATLLNAFGRPWTRAQLETDCRVTAQGSSLLDLREALRGRGLQVEGLRGESPDALLRVRRPFIAHLGSGHFVVVVRHTGHGFEVFDPASGRVWIWSPEELHRRGQGAVLSVGRPSWRGGLRSHAAPGG